MEKYAERNLLQRSTPNTPFYTFEYCSRLISQAVKDTPNRVRWWESAFNKIGLNNVAIV